MYPKKKTPAERGQMIFMIVCLSFLLGTVGGAVAANLAGRSGEETLVRFLQEHLTAGGDSSFWYTFWKYMKYDSAHLGRGMAFHGGIHFRVCLSVPRNFVGVYGGNAHGKLWRQRRMADHIGDFAPESAVDSGLCCHDNGSGLLPFCMGRRRHQKGCKQTRKTAAADGILHIIGGV